ncbi:hypothetical protein ACQBAT_06505 [Ornithinimicrobium sp. Y1847]|uniref:hypothetical protein n=1 Tax=Ornithinimicrobium sp. Y1847 TaxID=3405419 RepID=UPI003B67394E
MASDDRWYIHDDSALWLREQPDVPRVLVHSYQYDLIDDSPLPADEALRMPLAEEQPPHLEEILAAAEPLALRIGGRQFRTALRRLVALIDWSWPMLDLPRQPTCVAASLIATLGAINGISDVTDGRPSRLLESLGVDQGRARHTAGRMLHSLGWRALEDVPYVMRHPDLTVSWVRRDLLEDPEDEFCPWDEEEVRYFRT